MSDRIMLNVIVNLDPVMGAFHTPQQAREAVEAILLSRIGHYSPVVMLAPENNFSAEKNLVFDKTNPNWSANQQYNKLFVKMQNQYFNDRLMSRGHVFLNEVLDGLGIERTPAGAVLGWTKDQGPIHFEVTTDDPTDDGAALHINVRVAGNIQHEI